MKTFKQSKKGCINIGDKTYFLKTDSMTLTLVMMDSIPKMEEARDIVFNVKKRYELGEIAYDELLIEIEKSFKSLERHCERFLKRIFGEEAYREIIVACGGFSFDDMQNLTVLVIEELTDLKNSENKTLIGGVKGD